jgi:hypothetical protein
MKLRWAALGVVLALSALMPQAASAQTGQPARTGRPKVTLEQNYPNPFNPETWIPFGIDEGCTEPGRQYRVTMRIYNLLSQEVAVPVIQGGSGSTAGGERIENITITCGKYTAYWNGKYKNSNRDAASGVYVYRLEVDGRPELTKKFLVTK